MRTTAGGPPPTARRVPGVDVARAIAVLAMIVLHVLPPASESGQMTVPWRLSVWNAAALFALVSGVAMGLSTGRAPLRGRAWGAAAVAVLVRASIIGALGLMLGYALPPDVQRAIIILPFFAVLFVLAIPLLALSVRWLVALTGVLAVGVPLLSHLVRGWMPAPWHVNPTFADLLGRPVHLAGELLLTGVYPALPYLAYVCAGLAIGRSRVSSARVQLAVVAAGAALATLASVVSWYLMDRRGGLDVVLNDGAGLASLTDAIDDLLVWGSSGTVPTTSPWWLAVLAPNSATPFDLLFTIGVSTAIVGACLMLARLLPRLLAPLATFGSMTLTLYCAHVLLLAAPVMWVLGSTAEFVVNVVILFGFALLWSRRFERGPLEQVVASATHRARGVVG
jgi:hypothetical protein